MNDPKNEENQEFQKLRNSLDLFLLTTSMFNLRELLKMAVSNTLLHKMIQEEIYDSQDEYDNDVAESDESDEYFND